MKVLIVDDNIDNLEMLEILLKSKNFSVIGAKDGKEALDILNSETFNLIVSDILMPVMDGFQLCKEVKQNDKLKQIPFVFYTATYVDLKDEEFALSLGAEKFVRKPLDPEKLLKILLEVIDKIHETDFEARNTGLKFDNETALLKVYNQRLIAKLEKKNIDLEREVAAHKKTIEELVVAKDKAEESDRLKSAFLANMSHEIRTPMNAVIGFSKILQKENLTEEERLRFMNYVNNNGESLIKIIDDIIHISVIDAKQLKILNEPFVLSEMLDEIRVYFSGVIQNSTNKNIDFKVIDETNFDNCFHIIADKARIKLVLDNLINNSIKYTQQGSIILKVTGDKSKLKFSVKDTGIGISKSNLASVFDRFIQYSKEFVSRHYGTGLGLSISKELVELMGGEIFVESEEDKGSVFTFYIPIELDKKSEHQENKIDAGELNEINFKNKKILVVDDEEAIYVLFKRMLKGYGGCVEWASNGKVAIEKVMANDYNIILMDLRMPIIDGYEATAKIKALKPNIPIIVQTAYALPEYELKARNAGCDDYISKPVKDSDLIEKVNEFIL
ncbi:MAG: response regulator [Salinivirgaceae bacterium]|nr:response regulator [Salinivirgaceae bacterium]